MVLLTRIKYLDILSQVNDHEKRFLFVKYLNHLKVPKPNLECKTPSPKYIGCYVHQQSSNGFSR